ncbi:MAG TPA: hydrolase [Gemmatimonadaceae bacterium]|nr:hydrolase [Gemmatimonadaceae bacterium]
MTRPLDQPDGAARPYRPAWWVPGPHLRTLWGKLFRRVPRVPLRRERLETPDGDFLDLHRLDAPPGAPATTPLLLLLHGLEGSHRSHYVAGMLDEARRRGWAAAVLVWRSCGDEPNRAPRFYHSGETTDLDLVVRRLTTERPDAPLLPAGVSLGGNILLKWLGERGADVPAAVRAAAAVSVPFDLARGARHIDRGFSRVYQAHFLRTLRRKALEKHARFPALIRAEAAAAARTLWEFDDVVTAPVHGFRDAADYYERSSSLGFLAGIRVPTLLLSAADDPFLPAAVLDEVGAVARQNPALRPEFVAQGGHVGFISGTLPWRPLYWGEWRVVEWLGRAMEC